MAACELCDSDGGELIVRREKWRIVRVPGADGTVYRGFCRVVWNEHVKELTDLSERDRQNFMDAVFALETVLRQVLRPEKMNLASLGNITQHLHWHVIPRFRDDPAYPKPIWAISAPAPSSLDTLSDKQTSDRAHADQEWVSAIQSAFAIN